MRDLVNQKFGKLLVVSFNRKEGKQYFWDCVCECGTKSIVRGYSLTSGHSKSCGCDNNGRKIMSNRFYRHGGCETKEYQAWEGMKRRCNSPKSRMYPWYGGRGISVCERWQHSFENFLADMGKKPSPRHSLDRIDNNGNYEPSNCRWATRGVQDRNTRRNHWIEYNGERKIITDWANILGVFPSALLPMIRKRGVENAFNYYKNKI